MEIIRKKDEMHNQDIVMAKIVHRENNGKINIHWHNAFEIVFLLRGEISVIIENVDCPIPLFESDSLLIPPGCAHDIQSHLDIADVLIIQFFATSAMIAEHGIERSFNLLADEINTVRTIRSQGKYASQAAFLCHEILRLHKEQDPLSNGIACGAIQMLLSYYSEEKPLSRALSSIDDNRQLDLIKMCAYIDESGLGVVTLESVADYMGYSKKYFSLKFKEITGKSFKQFLDRLKMQEARRLLGEGKRVAEIANILGYSCVQSFYRAFKRIHHVTSQVMLNRRE